MTMVSLGDGGCLKRNGRKERGRGIGERRSRNGMSKARRACMCRFERRTRLRGYRISGGTTLPAIDQFPMLVSVTIRSRLSHRSKIPSSKPQRSSIPVACPTLHPQSSLPQPQPLLTRTSLPHKPTSASSFSATLTSKSSAHA